MRVIAGTAKGHPIRAPRRKATRPATDLVRGAIFSILENMVYDWTNVLDLFSGSGAMGIEALSRGADWVDFVDHEPRCCAIIKQNLERIGFTDRACIHCATVERAISFLDKEYNIVVMDPPYSNAAIGKTITSLAESRLVGAETTIIVTHSIHLQLDSCYAPYSIVKERRHGDSVINVYQYSEGVS